MKLIVNPFRLHGSAIVIGVIIIFVTCEVNADGFCCRQRLDPVYISVDKNYMSSSIPVVDYRDGSNIEVTPAVEYRSARNTEEEYRECLKYSIVGGAISGTFAGVLSALASFIGEHTTNKAQVYVSRGLVGLGGGLVVGYILGVSNCPFNSKLPGFLEGYHEK